MAFGQREQSEKNSYDYKFDLMMGFSGQDGEFLKEDPTVGTLRAYMVSNDTEVEEILTKECQMMDKTYYVNNTRKVMKTLDEVYNFDYRMQQQVNTMSIGNHPFRCVNNQTKEGNQVLL